MIDFALEAERDQGITAQEAIVQACILRFRPIKMTTRATLFGALPLALDRFTSSSRAPAKHEDNKRKYEVED